MRRLAPLLLIACGSLEDLVPGIDGSVPGIDGWVPGIDGSVPGTERADAGGDAGAVLDSGTPDAGPPRCRTRITYGSAWIKPPGHPNDFDDVTGLLTWDGGFAIDGAGNCVAELSNGWRPVFACRTGCVMSLDTTCMPGTCATRIAYGTGWLAPPNHPARFDDVSGILTSDGVCQNNAVTLSPGWRPTFNGPCEHAIRYTQCGPLFANPVVANDCPDPGVTHDPDAGYVMVCTSGGPGFPIRTSPDLVRWTFRGAAMTQATKPAWATGDFWAPELHRSATGWVLYFSARHTNGSLAVGAATAPTALGPFTAQATPLVTESGPGVIDVHVFQSPDGKRWLLWKRDGNAVGQATPIRIQELGPDGVTRIGGSVDLITNDRPWEGAVVEGPWMIHEAGTYYLFYSANGYASTAYAVGVARASSPTGPFTKLADPILVTKGAWAGPGHGSVLKGPRGDWVHVFHSWVAGSVGQAPGRQVLVERVTFQNGWPVMHAAPSARSQPLP